MPLLRSISHPNSNISVNCYGSGRCHKTILRRMLLPEPKREFCQLHKARSTQTSIIPNHRSFWLNGAEFNDFSDYSRARRQADFDQMQSMKLEAGKLAIQDVQAGEKRIVVFSDIFLIS